MRLLTDTLVLNGIGTLQQQLYQLLQHCMLSGQWPHGAMLPSSRQLAQDLSLSRNTVNQVLAQLVTEGYLDAFAGRGYQVAANFPDYFFQPAGIAATAVPALTVHGYALPLKVVQPAGKLQPGVPDLGGFPFGIWQRLLQRHASRKALAGFVDPLGYLPLRQALASYLRQSRQVLCSEQNILITAGAQQGLMVAAKLTAKAGDQVLMESPGYPRLKQALQLCELQIAHVKANGLHGLDVGSLPIDTAAKALFLTPGHQYPLGGIMPLAQRLTLLEWARAQQCWLIEDDYDSEYQYQQRPVASLQGLAGGEGVIFVGSCSKTLFPALRLGYMVAPEPVIQQAAAIVQALHGDVAVLPQAVLADFINEGHFNRHLRKMRRSYQQKKHQACQLLQQYLPQCRLLATDAGLHLVLCLPDNCDDQALARQLQTQQLNVQPLSRYLFLQEASRGLVLGIADGTLSQQQLALQQVADTVQRYLHVTL